MPIDPLDVYRCDKATGEHARAAFLFPELGTIDADAPRSERMKQLADRITDPKDGRLAATVVNRYLGPSAGPRADRAVGQHGAGIVASRTARLAGGGSRRPHYDLKRTLEVICTSQTYQLPSVGEPRPGETISAFRGPTVRRMTAEQFVDAVATLTGVWQTPTGDLLKVDGRGQGGQVGAVRDVLRSKKSPDAEREVAQVRAALAMDNALSRALGRPNREQVVTRRDTLATMLQALELVNGTTLDAVLNRGARRWMKDGQHDPLSIVERAYRLAIGRSPSTAEKSTAASIVGTQPTVDGIHDLLWVVVMLPEFQLID